MGTTSHSHHAMRACSHRNTKGRSNSTSRIALLATRLTRTSACRIVSASTIKPLYQAFEFVDFLAAQVLPLRELGNEGRDAPAKQRVDEVAALLVHVVFAPQQRTVQVTA